MSRKPVEFSFNAPLLKAFRGADGSYHVTAKASDTLPDSQGDRMSLKALKGMAQQAKKDGLPLLDNHRSTFGFAKTVDAQIIDEVIDGTPCKSFVADFELDMRFVESQVLYEEVDKGTCEKQLSVGGSIDMENPAAVSWSRGPDGALRRTINEITLDHIAATRKDMAVNDRTGFLTAIAKSIGEAEPPKGKDPMKKTTAATVKAIPHRSYDMAPEDMPWNFTEKSMESLLGKDGGNWPRVKHAHAWFNPEADPNDPDLPEEKSAYGFPHHVVGANGQLQTVLAGVVKAAADLLGATGGEAGAGLPKSAQGTIAKHLAAHYREFDRTPPPALDAVGKGRAGSMSADEFIEYHRKINGLDVSAWLNPPAPVAKADEAEAKPEEKPAEVKADEKKDEATAEKATTEQAKPEGQPANATKEAAAAPVEEKAKEGEAPAAPAEKKDEAAPAAPAEVAKAKADAPATPARVPLAERVAKALAGEVPAAPAAPVAPAKAETVEKSMYNCNTLGSVLMTLAYVVKDEQYDVENKGKEAAALGKLKDALKALVDAYGSMCEAEMAELSMLAEKSAAESLLGKGGEVAKALETTGFVHALGLGLKNEAHGPKLRSLLKGLLGEEAPAAPAAGDLVTRDEVATLVTEMSTTLGAKMDELLKGLTEKVGKVTAEVNLASEALADVDKAVELLTSDVAKAKDLGKRLDAVEAVAGTRQSIQPGNTDDVLEPGQPSSDGDVRKGKAEEGGSVWGNLLPIEKFRRQHGAKK